MPSNDGSLKQLIVRKKWHKMAILCPALSNMNIEKIYLHK